MKKTRVAVLMGGKTPEHEISLISGREVVRNLPSNYEVIPVVISRNGKKWSLPDKQSLLQISDPLELLGTKKDIVLKGSVEIVDGIEDFKSKIDVCFIAMHGPFGEDGTIQGMLELAGVPYTGPGVLASALGMDKIIFRKVLAGLKFPIPKYFVINRDEPLTKKFKKLGKPPYFVKPHNQGSSVGNSVVRKKKYLQKALNLAFKYSQKALVDEYVEGKEVVCGVLGNEDPKALPLVEIVPLKGDFFDYASKYTQNGAEEIVPARISQELTKKVQQMAIDIYKSIGCQGFSRVDFILEGGKRPLVLEINTIPGLTPMSLFPKAAKAAGITYSRLLDKIIKYALKK